MATRSAIGYVDDSGNIHSVYCHWDGYPSYVGAVLYTFYNNLEAIKRLIEKGDMSSILDAAGEDETKSHLPVGPVHYHEWRNEDWDGVKPKTHGNVEAVLACRREQCAEYFYLFKNGKWLCHEYKWLCHEYADFVSWEGFENLKDVLAYDHVVNEHGGLEAYCQAFERSVEQAKQSQAKAS